MLRLFSPVERTTHTHYHLRTYAAAFSQKKDQGRTLVLFSPFAAFAAFAAAEKLYHVVVCWKRITTMNHEPDLPVPSLPNPYNTNDI